MTRWVLAVLAIALAGSLALAAKIADRDCTHLADPPLSALPWVADSLAGLQAQAYARCIQEAR